MDPPKKRKFMEGEQKDSKKPSTKKMSADAEEVVVDEKAWQAVIQRLPRCSAVEGLRETSYFRNKEQPSGGRSGACLRKLLHELGTLEDSLPTQPAIWLRFDEETPQFLRALITAPPGTPYSHGLFCFDMYIPDNYPVVHPKIQLLTTGGGTVRFSPNLYANGVVCLSLLGTWHGPKWNPLHSSILQVLVSIQGLILGVEHPYYLEPGHGGWDGDGNAKQGATVPAHVKRAEDEYRKGTVKFAMLEMCRGKASYMAPFQEVIAAHFTHYQQAILREARSWADTVPTYRSIKPQLQQLEKELGKLKPPPAPERNDETAKPSPKEAPANDSAALKGQVGSMGEIQDEQATSSVVDIKRRAMEQAASKGDYIKAGQLQSELQHLESQGVEAQIISKRREMEEAAGKGDYITAGQLQQQAQYLEKHKKRLQGLQRRMFEAAAKQDFVRAGRFQEQCKILLESKDDPSSSEANLNSITANSAAMWDQGDGPTSYLISGSFGSNSMTPPFPPAPGFGAGTGGGFYGAYDQDYLDDVYD